MFAKSRVLPFPSLPSRSSHPRNLKPPAHPRSHQPPHKDPKLGKPLPKFRVLPLTPRIQYSTHSRDPIQAPTYRRREDRIPSHGVCRRPRHLIGHVVRHAVGVVERCETEASAHRHCLAVVEARVGWPARIEDVRFIEVGDEGPYELGGGTER